MQMSGNVCLWASLLISSLLCSLPAPSPSRGRNCLGLQRRKNRQRRIRPRHRGSPPRTRPCPFGTFVQVTNKKNGRSVIVRINDRGPFIGGRIIDLTPAGAKAIGSDGLAPVTLTVLGRFAHGAGPPTRSELDCVAIDRTKQKPPPVAGACLPTPLVAGSELTVAPQHHAARLADPMADRGQRRATAQQIAHAHVAARVAISRRGRLARHQIFGVDRAGRCRERAKQSNSKKAFHHHQVPVFVN